jgi:tetratricopeptide (TPR) repeat protein
MTMKANSFGKQLRYFRRRAHDPERGGSLTQERLTHLLYDTSALEYSFAAVSDWERGKSQIPKDHRSTLLGLVATLGKYGGILSVAEVNDWLAAGNYRPLADEDIVALRAAGLDWPELTVGQDASGRYVAPFLAPPRPFQPIVGRDDALSGLRERLLDREAVTISAVRGLPGVGKTTLAQVLAHDPVMQQAFPDGVFWVGLGRNPDLFFHLGLWADALAMDRTEIRQMTAVGLRAAAIRARLSNRAALLIIDDVWQAKHAGSFRLGGKDCAHIVTTRLPAVTDAFSDAHRVIVETLDEKESLRLLRYLAPQVYQQFPTTVERLAKESGGLPLTLMLMGSYLRQQSDSGQSRRLEQALHNLQDQTFRLHIEMPQAGVHAHPSLPVEQAISLTSIIGVSEEALPHEDARHALRALGLFPPKPNSFSEAAAAAVMDQPLELLDVLVDAGLVESKGQERCQIHQAIADYLAAQETPTAAARRFVAFYASWLADRKADAAAVELEMDNVLTAVALAEQIKASDSSIALTTHFLPFLEQRSLWSVIDQLTPKAIEQAQKVGDYQAAITLLHQLARSFDTRQEKSKADDYLAQALQIAREYGGVERLVSLLAERSLAASEIGDDDVARAYLQEALTAARNAGYVRGMSMTLGYLGRLSHQSGVHEQTPLYLDEAITLAREHAFPDLLCGLLILRGAAASYSETADDAEQYYLEALNLARTVGRKDQLSAILTNLGEIETNRGGNERATAYLEEALDIVRESGSAVREAHIRKDLGILAMRRGDVDGSQRHFEAGLSLAEESENEWLAGYIEVHWAELALQSGDAGQAGRLAEQVVARLPDSSKNRSIVAIALFVQAQLAAQQGERDLACRLAEQSATRLHEIGHARSREVANWLAVIRRC